MKRLCLSILFVPLLAQPPFTILSVDRLGLPPYERENRIYRLNGGEKGGVKVGARLAVRRPGERQILGHLKVVTVSAEEAETVFLPAKTEWPMKGDQAWPDPLPGLPQVAALSGAPLVLPAAPLTGATAPPREGVLFFLPQRAELSPAGRIKLSTWVQEWGVPGRWVIQMPLRKAIKPALQNLRAEALLGALRECGVASAEIQHQTRTHESPYDPSWILHWD